MIGPEELNLLKLLDRMDQEGTAYRDTADRDRWSKYLDEFRGEQWQGSGHPMFLANIIGPAIDRKAALLTEAKPTLYIGPRRKGLSKTADLLRRTIDAGWDEYSVELVLEDGAYYVSILGAFFLKLAYAPAADDGDGDIVPSALDPRTVRIDPWVKRSHQLSQGQFVIVDSIEPLWQIWRRFPGRGALVTPTTRFSPIDPEAGAGGFWSKVRSRLGGPDEPVKASAVQRAWLREYQFHDPTLAESGEPRYPFGRHVIRGGEDVVLLDEPNPYWDGGWDLDMLDGKPDLDSAWGRSEVEALRKIQESLNRLGDQYVRNIIRTGNVWVVADADALEPDAVNKITNAEGIVVTKRFGRTIERHAPPAMPAHYLDFMRMSLQFVDILTGMSDGNLQGRGRVEMRSGAQFEGLQLAAQTLVRAQARRMESFLTRVGQKWISRIFQFYQSDRMMTVLGRTDEWQQFEFERQGLLSELLTQAQASVQRQQAEGQDLGPDALRESIERHVRRAWKDFRFRVAPGSSLAATRMQRAQMFGQLAQQGLVQMKRVPEALGIEAPEEEIALARQQLQQFPPIGQPPKKGRRQ